MLRPTITNSRSPFSRVRRWKVPGLLKVSRCPVSRFVRVVLKPGKMRIVRPPGSAIVFS
jgi:hypothetical protein